jgi:hypothetical protein
MNPQLSIDKLISVAVLLNLGGTRIFLLSKVSGN